MQKHTEQLSIYQSQSDNDLMQCSIGVTERYRIFATFLHGLFAGMTLIHMIFSLAIGGSVVGSQQAFLFSYAVLQQPLAIYNYVAFVVILVSLWDRVDVGEPSRQCGPSQVMSDEGCVDCWGRLGRCLGFILHVCRDGDSLVGGTHFFKQFSLVEIKI